jgi:hypothetical protein
MGSGDGHAQSPKDGWRRRSGRETVRISELTGGARRLALVGLAKNTGKTQTLTTLLAEHARDGVRVGVTSIGRDGEERDVLDARIFKPRIRLAAGSLVASTGGLLRASGVEHERLARTGVRTPLGEVVIARVQREGLVEVAGPSAAQDVREVSEQMLGMGAERVLIDGAIDRRAASSPAVSDGLVMATGAVLGEEAERVAAATAEAVELVGLPAADLQDGARTAASADAGRAADSAAAAVRLERGLVLHAEQAQIAALLREHADAEVFLVEGALGERFLEGLLGARRERAGRELRIVATDPTRVFLSRRGPSWYRRQGVAIEVLQRIELKAITVNPVAPRSHRLDSARLRELIEAAAPGVPVLDVLDPSYLALAK